MKTLQISLYITPSKITVREQMNVKTMFESLDHDYRANRRTMKVAFNQRTCTPK